MPYLILFAVSLVVGILGLRRGPISIFVASLIGLATSLGLTDLLVAGILRLYLFRPHFLASVSQDNPLGFFLSDFTAVPMLYSGLAMLFPRHRVWTSLLLAGLLAVIETGFVFYGVFIHQAWSVWISLPLFILRFLLATWWISLLERIGYTPAFRAFLIGISVHIAWFFWIVWISSILRVWIIFPGLLTNPDSDRVLGAWLYHGLPFTMAGSLAIVFRWSRTAGGGLLTFALLVAYLLWLDGSGLWRRPSGWSPILEGAVLTMLVMSVSLLDRWYAARLSNPPPWSPPVLPRGRLK